MKEKGRRGSSATAAAAPAAAADAIVAVAADAIVAVAADAVVVAAAVAGVKDRMEVAGVAGMTVKKCCLQKSEKLPVLFLSPRAYFSKLLTLTIDC